MYVTTFCYCGCPHLFEIQIWNRPRIHKSLFFSVQVKKKEIEYEFLMRSSAEMHKTCPVLMKKMSLCYETLVASQVNFEATI